jgi:N-acetylmuramic acid 6-phosphate etherase
MALSEISSLQTETRNLKTRKIDEVSTLDMCNMINREDAGVADAVRQCLPQIATAIDAAAPRIRQGGRLIYVGAGTSGR